YYMTFKYFRSASTVFVVQDLFFTIFEFYVFYAQFRAAVQQHKKNPTQRAVQWLFLTAIVLAIAYDILFENGLNRGNFQDIALIQDVFLLVVSGLYFYDLFTNRRKDDYRKDPSFWVMSGLLICMTCILPFSL